MGQRRRAAGRLVLPLDDQRQWYRYHQLFAEALQARLLKEQPHLMTPLHQRASAWFEQRSVLPRHVLAVQDFDRAADLIELGWTDIRRSCFRSPTWLGWVQALPDDLLRVRPVLCVGYAWELLNFGVLYAAAVRMQDTERWLEAPAAQGPSDETGP